MTLQLAGSSVCDERGRGSRCPSRSLGREDGVIFIWVLVSFFVIAVLLIAAVQPASIIMKREREKDLVFRGEEYVEAIRLFQSEHGGAFPTKMEQLIQTGPKQHRYIRKLWENPFDPEGKWTLLGPGVTVVTMGEDGKPVFTSSGIGQGINQGINQRGIGTGGLNTTAATPGQPGAGQGLQPGTPGEVLPFKVGGEEGQPILGVSCRLHEKAFADLRGKEYYDEWFFSPLVMPPPPPAGVRTLPQVQPGQTPRPTPAQ